MKNKLTLGDEEKMYCLEKGITDENEMINFLQNSIATDVANLKMEIKEVFKKRELSRKKIVSKAIIDNSQLNFFDSDS